MSSIIAQPPFRAAPDGRAGRFVSIFRDASRNLLRDCVFAWHPRMGTYATLGPKYGYQRLAGTYSGGARMVYDRWAGVYRTFPANTIPITGVQEPGVTNLLTYSGDWSNSSGWDSQLGALITANAGTAPDGSATAALVDHTPAQYCNRRHSSYTVTSGQIYTFSFWAKRVSGTGSPALFHEGGFAAAYTELGAPLSASWVRYTVTLTANASTGTRFGLQDRAASNRATVLVWGAQLEVNGYATSYIPTTTAAVARAADAFRFTNSSLLDGLKAEGSLLLVFKTPYASTTPTTAPWLASLNGNAGADLAGFFTKDSDDKLYAQLVSGGIDAGGVALSTYSANTWYAAAMAWNAGDVRAAINGTGGTAYGATDLPAGISGLEIGAQASGSTRQGAEYALIAAFDRALTQAELNARTLNPERYVGQAA